MGSKYSMYSDAELTVLLAQDDAVAFETIYDRYWGALFRFARNMLRDDDQAKDVIQESFARLYERRDGLSAEKSLRSLLYTVVRNAILDIGKHKRVRADYLASFEDFAERGEFVTDHHVRERELERLIAQEIENLPPKMRALFEMSRKQYMSHKEIAEATGISEGTVKKQLSNAITRLRARLGCYAWLQLMSFILWLNR